MFKYHFRVGRALELNDSASYWRLIAGRVPAIAISGELLLASVRYLLDSFIRRPVDRTIISLLPPRQRRWYQSWIIPRRTAIAIACVRSFAPSLSIMCLM
jgi:hypothetical protein